ncbi:MAG: diguanylate cyclase with sensor [Frankiales bacterium]|jgi:two-component system cell cycle response regulator|nr:diguanylate cyclase with sensor [Frankiales bacterium]
MTLRTRLVAAFVAVVLVPLLVVVALLSSTLPAALADRQGQGLVSSGRFAATVVSELCSRARGAAEAAGRASATAAPEELRAALDQIVRSGVADGVRVVDADGASRAEAGAAPTLPPRDCSAGDAVRTGAGVQVVGVVQLQRPGGGAAGAAVAAFTVDKALATRLKDVAGRGQVAFLLDGEVIASSATVPPALVDAARNSGDDPVLVDGQHAFLTAARPGQPVGVLLTQRDEAGADVLPYALAATLLVGLVAIGIAALLARATTRPLEELGAAAARVSSGDLTTVIPVRSRDEVGRLAGSFNSMTDELRRYIGALESSRDELQAGVARLGDALSGTHDLVRILNVVLETAQASTRARAGAVLLLDGDGTELTVAVEHGLEEHDVRRDLRLPVGVGVIGQVAHSGTAVRGRMGDGPGHLHPGPGEPTQTALIAVPLKSSTKVIGVLVLFERGGGGEFGDDDLQTLRTFTSQATVAVDNVLLHEETRKLSITDGLTGLWNYRYFQMTVGKEIERAARFNRPLALLMLDLDHFKLVNDVHGHQRGDVVLAELAERVRRTVRDVDTLARYGGEEFVVVLPETDEKGAVQAAERINAVVRRHPFGGVGEEPLEITVSIGVALFPTHGATSAGLLRRADEALYAAKRGGRDGWRLAPPEPPRTPPGPDDAAVPAAAPRLRPSSS